MPPREFTSTFTPHNPGFARRVAESFAQQSAMHSLGITLGEIAPGFISLHMPFNAAFTQQNGFIHAGIITTALDSACGYAAFSLMPATADVLSIEFKTNLLSPAKASAFLIEAHVVKAGRTITVCEGKAFNTGEDAAPKLIATMTATMMTVTPRA